MINITDYSQTKEAKQFWTINSEINRLALAIAPSGSNGRIPEFFSAVENYFLENNLNQEIYWQVVFLKTPKKKRVEPTNEQ